MAKKPTLKDWHRADIIAAVRKTGTSIQALSFKNGYRRTTLGMALVHPYPKCERIIAEYLSGFEEYKGITAQQIWKSRYNPDGSRKSGQNARGLGRHKANGSTVKKSRNVNVHA